MSKNKDITIKIARAGIIAALYIVTSLITAPIASGTIQVRLSEALTLLPLLFPEAVPALFIGCAFSNLITACAPFDVLFGSIITICASVLTFGIGKLNCKLWIKILLGGLPPVLMNAFLLPIIWLYCYGTSEYIYTVQVGLLLVGQAISVYALGSPVYMAIAKKLNQKR